MFNKLPSTKGVLTQIVEVGLEVWLRSQCESINEVKLELTTTTLQLLSGRLSRAKLLAEKVTFKGLLLDKVELTSSPISLKINLSNQNQKISFREGFQVQGSISLLSQNIKDIILSPQWEWIGEWMANKLLESKRLESLVIKNDILELRAQATDLEEPKVGSFIIEAISGTLMFKNICKEKTAMLPMDQAIHIDHAIIQDGILHISVNAGVSP